MAKMTSLKHALVSGVFDLTQHLTQGAGPAESRHTAVVTDGAPDPQHGTELDPDGHIPVEDAAGQTHVLPHVAQQLGGGAARTTPHQHANAAVVAAAEEARAPTPLPLDRRLLGDDHCRVIGRGHLLGCGWRVDHGLLGHHGDSRRGICVSSFHPQIFFVRVLFLLSAE
eukprot:TRINITY_DN96884_c0_g1_i1.p1 TRINITY_DN96884_c0_g1~~TRINITY_DN96884_c0_g1_i1.p1  ORF type:complete len:169 (+),score=32.39 TRINITY_DN96884_c0_g1_i1:111-617(+)